MENIMDMLRILSDDKSNSIYLREIALLMEENEQLRVTIAKLKKAVELKKKEKRNYMCDNCGGGFNVEEIISTEDNDMCVYCMKK
jgi:formylmethanofuran dehydrogenase subunit E